MFANALSRTFLLLICAALVLAPTHVAAQSDADKAKARGYYVAGKKAFDKGDYATALNEYNQAYTLMPLPGLLFNIGQCYRNLERPQEAINAFNLYLEKSPNAGNRSGVEKLIAELVVVLREAKEDLPPDDPKPADPIPVDTPSDDKDPLVEDADPLTGTTDPDLNPDDTDKDPVVINAAATRTPDKTKPSSGTPVYKKWWFWTIIGAVVVGGGAATGVYFATRPGDPAMPNSSLGVLDYSR